MGNSSSSPKITAQDRAILQMKVQRDNLNNTSKKLGVVIQRETEMAKELLKRGDKKRALLALKKKKFQESSVDRISEQLLTLETLISTVEFKLVEKDFVYGLQQGNEILKQLNQELNLDKIENIMDKALDSVEYQQEVDLELSRNLNRADELAIDEELQLLIDAEQPALLPEAPTHEILPEAPTHEILPESPSNEIPAELDKLSDHQPIRLPA